MGSFQAERRPPDRAAARGDARQAEHAGAGRDAQQQGLGLVVAVVGGQQPRGAELDAQRLERGIADASRSGLGALAATALGADLAASARPMIRELTKGGRPALEKMLARWQRELQGIMFLTGSRTTTELQHAPLVRRCRE